jgi:WD repeat-containing protein 55
MDSDNPVPDEIKCSDQIFDVSFHPKVDALAVGLIDGSIEVYKYEVGSQNKIMLNCKNVHSASCRGVMFTDDGEKLYTISSDKSILGIDGIGRTFLNIPGAHDDPINKVISLSEGGLMIATGDDSGCVKLWDMRTSAKEVMSWSLHEDFVSGFAFNADANTLLSVGGDATLCTYDLRKQKNTNRSDDQEAELQCVQVMKGGKKVICGTQDGVILYFSWDRWGDCSDRFPGHPETVDCFLKLDESTVLTGSSDGLIRVVALQPNKVLGVIGDHEDFPVEGMRCSRDKRVLGSFAHDETVRFWDISMFAEDEDDEDEGEEVEESGKPYAKPRAKAAVKVDDNAAMEVTAEEDENGEEDDEDEDEEGGWEDMSEEEDSAPSSDSDDSDADDGGGKGGRKKLPSASEKFFADL